MLDYYWTSVCASVVTSQVNLDSSRLESQFLTWRWLDFTHLWNDSDLTLDSTACWLESTSDSSHDKWLESLQITWVMTHTRSKVFNVNNVELWTMTVPSFNFRWERYKIEYYLVTSVNIKMVNYIPLRVFMNGHWDDHAELWQNIFVTYKRGIHYTIPTWGDLTLKRLGYFGGWKDWGGHNGPPWDLGRGSRDRRKNLHDW